MKIHNPNNLKTIDYRTLKEFQGNLKDLSERNAEKLKRVLEKRGFKIPLYLWDSPDGLVLLDGHQRLRVMQMNQLNDDGNYEVPYILIEAKDEAEAREQLLEISSQYGTMTQEGFDEFTAEIPEFDGMDVNFDALAFVGKEEEPEVEEDEAPEVDESEPPKSKLGEIYQLGKHRVMCGDSTDFDTVSNLMNGNLADMVFTDPPYGVEYTGGHNKKKRTGIENDELQGQDLTDLFHGSLSNAIQISNNHSAFYIWYASGKSVDTFASFANLGLELRAVIQWYKVNSGLGAFMSQYIPNCEPCMYAFKIGHSPQWFGASDEKTVWELKREGKSEYHPTQKPIELCARAIKNSSKAGQIVYDAFLGSGSTLIACEQTDRICYGMELDPKYVDVIRKRYAKFCYPDTWEERWEELTPEVS